MYTVYNQIYKEERLMDAKSREILKQYHTKFQARDFIELDVLGFLIHIRALLNKNTEIHEICDFVAHRNKDRGIAFDYFNKLNNLAKNSDAPIFNEIKRKGLYSPIKIKDELNAFFAKWELDELENIVIFEILECIISFMQHIIIKHNNQTVTKFSAFFDGSWIGLCGVLDSKNTFKFNNLTITHGYHVIPILLLKCNMHMIYGDERDLFNGTIFLKENIISLYRNDDKKLLIKIQNQ